MKIEEQKKDGCGKCKHSGHFRLATGQVALQCANKKSNLFDQNVKVSDSCPLFTPKKEK